MGELKKYWQAMAEKLAQVRAGDERMRATGLRVDIAGCRVTAPPVRQQQGASYIPRTRAVASPLGSTEKEEDQGGKRYAVASTDQVDIDVAGRAATSHPGNTFRELLAAPFPLSDDVLFIPIAPAAGSADSALPHGSERRPMARFI